jgi:RNA polymerase sigma-70 factor (ECF subfamily)
LVRRPNRRYFDDTTGPPAHLIGGLESDVTDGPELAVQQEIVAGAMRGDRTAMDALWAEHRRWIAAVLLSHKSPQDQLDDLLQDVAMTMVNKVNTLRETRNIRAWLRTVAVNAARASARSHNARPVLASLGGDAPGTGRCAAGEATMDDEARRMLDLASKLPETYREPLMLRAVHGMRGRHISEILDLPEATVETRIARARRMLRELAGGQRRRDPAVAGTINARTGRGTTDGTGT